MMPLHTEHSLKRSAQRAISSEIIALTFHHGHCLDLPGGVSRIYCPKKCIRKLEREKLVTAQQARKLKSTYLVVSEDGMLITTGYLTKAAKRAGWTYT